MLMGPLNHWDTGIYSQEDTGSGTVSISELPPPGLRQTNNAELGGGGGVQVLNRVPGDKLAILPD